MFGPVIVIIEVELTLLEQPSEHLPQKPIVRVLIKLQTPRIVQKYLELFRQILTDKLDWCLHLFSPDALCSQLLFEGSNGEPG